MIIGSREADRQWSLQSGPGPANSPVDMTVTLGQPARRVVIQRRGPADGAAVRLSWSTDGSPSGDPGLPATLSTTAKTTLFAHGGNCEILARRTAEKITDIHVNWEAGIEVQIQAFA